MSKCQDLPNVYPELPSLQFMGELLVVRNTFIEVEAPSSEQLVCRRSRSAPNLRSALVEQAKPSEGTERMATQGLCEVQGRAFDGAARGEVEHSMTRARSRTDFAHPDCHGRALPDSFSDSCAGFSGSVPGSGDCDRMDLRSNASTRAPSPSSRSTLSKSTFETSSLVGSRHAVEEEAETTFRIRGLPPQITRAQFEELLDSEGFQADYDFLYLPTDLKAGGNFGYGFINLINPKEGERFQDHFHGYQWPDADLEPMGVYSSEELQGLDELIARYRNSPVMHKTVPPGMRPAIYKNGKVVPFPSPTVRLRPLRVRGSANRKLPGQGTETRAPKA